MSELSAPQRPVSVWVVYVVLILQGSAVLVVTVGALFTEDPVVLDTAGQIALMVLYVLAGAVLIILAFRLFMGSSAARTPAMVLQVLVVILSFSFFAGGAILVGLVFLVPAGTALVLLFVPATQRWLQARSAS